MSLLSGLLDALLPPTCGACGQAGREPFCRVCSEALVDAEPFDLPGIEHALAPFAYGGPVADALQHLKYDGHVHVARPLAAVLAFTFGHDVDLVLPVPLAKDRLRARGYNQAFELARRLVPRADPFLLIRPRSGPPQVSLSAVERHRNVAGAFEVRDRTKLKGRRVLLVDDVITTGATMTAAATTVLAAGATSVFALAVARADVGTPGV